VSRRQLFTYGGTVAIAGGGWYLFLRDSSSSQDWLQFQFDAQNSGHSPAAAGPVDGIQRRWTPFSADSPVGSPVVADGTVYAVDTARGEDVWQVDVGGQATEAPAVVDGDVYVGTGDEQLYALDATDGRTVWQADLSAGKDGHFGLTVADGTVFAGDEDRAFAVDAASGDPEWEVADETGAGQGSPPVVADGSGAWSDPFRTDHSGFSAPAVANGVVYILGDDGSVYLLDAATGRKIDRFGIGARGRSAPAVADGTLYVGSDDGTLHALQ